VQTEPYFLANAVAAMSSPISVYPGIVILELKFGTRFPDWMRELVRRFNLMQFSASKYCEGIVQLGEHHFHDGDRALDWEGWTPQKAESRRLAAGHQALETAELPQATGQL
jgi:hypothetical protein